MDQNAKQKTIDNLTKAETIQVAVSKSQGVDGLAAGLALYLSCVKLDKNVSIIAKAPSVGDAQKLYGVDKIGKFEGKQNLVIVVDNAVENVDKVTYFLDGDRLKIVVHPFPGAQGVKQDQISFENAPTKPDLIFAIGYSSPEELKQEIAHEQNTNPNTWLVNINKRDVGQIFAQVNIFDENAASISEITGHLLQDLALPLDEDIAYNLYQGILESTNHFSPDLTNPNSFEVASWLLKFGAGRASLAGGPSRQVQEIRDVQTGTSPLTRPESRPNPMMQSFPTSRPGMQRPSFPPMPSRPRTAPVMPQIPVDEPPEEYVYSDEIDQTPLEQVERAPQTAQNDWLKPPKVYKGSKSFDKEG